jgi:hypothetical protein
MYHKYILIKNQPVFRNFGRETFLLVTISKPEKEIKRNKLFEFTEWMEGG